MPTVLLVDNEPAWLEAFRYALEHCGYTVLCATSGDSAIRVCHGYAGNIDVLVSDVVMPGIGGLEIAAIVKSAHPSAVVILMSGQPRHTLPQAFVADAFVEKTLAHQELLAAISRHATTASVGATRESWH